MKQPEPNRPRRWPPSRASSACPTCSARARPDRPATWGSAACSRAARGSPSRSAFGGGLLTSLTPCVYPLIPITVSIFGARQAGSRGQAMLLSGLYVLGIAVTYSALGVGAALTGQAFGSVMQNPLVVGGRRAGPGRDGRLDVRRLRSRAPAVAPGAAQPRRRRRARRRLRHGAGGRRHRRPLHRPGARRRARRHRAEGLGRATASPSCSPTRWAWGCSSSSSAPSASPSPRAAPWMETVKSIFGVGAPGRGRHLPDGRLSPRLKPLFSAARAAAPLAAAAVAAVGVLLGALHRSFHGRGARAGAQGGRGGAAGRRRSSTPPAPPTPARGPGPRPFAWLHDEPAALALARAEGRPLLVDFWAEWCVACKELDRFVWSDPAGPGEGGPLRRAEARRHRRPPRLPGARGEVRRAGMPTVVFVDSTAAARSPARVVGAVTADEMLQYLEAAEVACDAPAAVACATRW